MTDTSTETVEHLECTSCGGKGCDYCKNTGKRARRLDGYYIGFESTGNRKIDKILGAVACAGKAYHHTDCWNDETKAYDDHTGRDPNEWIQNAAREAVDALQAQLATARNDALEEAYQSLISRWGEEMDVYGIQEAADEIWACAETILALKTKETDI